MRTYEVPFLLDDEPKLIGGKMTLRQGAYVLGGALLAFSALRRLGPKSLVLAGVSIAAIAVATLLLAFWKVPETDLYVDKYLVRLALFKAGTHAYTYSRRREAGPRGLPR
jgi:hypothetical protein